MWRAGLAAVEPEAAVRRHLRVVAPGVLGAGRHEIALSRLWLVGAGKGAAAMARGVAAVVDVAGGLIVSPVADTCPVPLREGTHPLPSAASDEAARELAEVVAGIPREDVVCAVWSGGGSASIAGPHPGVGLDDLVALSAALLASGEPIAATNTVRRRTYRLAGGRLRARARAPVFNLGLSDVPAGPDAPAILASGPTVPDPTTRDDAAAVLARLGRTFPLADDVAVPRGPYTWVGGVDDVVHAASHTARALGYVPVVLATAESRPVEVVVAGVLDAARAAAGGPPLALLVAGEPRVAVGGTGRGGRCQHAAALLARDVGRLPLTALIAGLDGLDGNTPAAGAFADGETRARAGAPPDEALREADSHTWLAAAGDVFAPGRTGTACCDLWVVLVG